LISLILKTLLPKNSLAIFTFSKTFTNEEKTVRDEDWFFIFLIFSSWFSGGRDDDGDVVGMMMGRW
jgi:hypothetical protein